MTRHRWFHALAGLMVVVAAALWSHVPRLAPGAFNWAEPGNIAAALAEGRGFSDPFTGGSGPTAWMPPVFPALIAGVFLVTGVKTTASAVVLIALAVVGVSLAHALLISLVSEQGVILRWAASLSFLGLVLVLPGGFVDVLSEAWLSVLFTTLLLWGLCEHRRAPRPQATAALGSAAALGPLTHAGLLAGAVSVLVVLLWLDRREPRSPRVALLALGALVLATGAWTLRNRITLGRWVPIKSNAWFELHLTSVVSSNGLVRADEVLPRHPFFDTAEFARYSALGEMNYVDTFRAPALARIQTDPVEFLRRVGRRAVNAFGVIASDETVGYTRHAFPARDRPLLAASGLLILLPPELGAQWLALETSPETVRDRLRWLPLEDRAGAFRDWLSHREEAARRRSAWLPRLSRLLLSGLPLLAVAAAFLLGHYRLPPVAAWALWLHFSTLLPFVLINHGARQQFPQMSLYAVFFAAFVVALTTRRCPAAA